MEINAFCSFCNYDVNTKDVEFIVLREPKKEAVLSIITHITHCERCNCTSIYRFEGKSTWRPGK